jgi:hypothetical protein
LRSEIAKRIVRQGSEMQNSIEARDVANFYVPDILADIADSADFTARNIGTSFQ